MISFLNQVGQALANQGIGSITEAALGVARAGANEALGRGNVDAVAINYSLVASANLLAKLAADVWKDVCQENQHKQLQEDVLAISKLSFEEAKQVGQEVAERVTRDPELQDHIGRFITLIPASIRSSLRRAEDPTGTSLPSDFAIQDADDIIKILPARLPRFKSGDRPTFLRGWQLVEQIGAGGFGEVWKTQNIRANNLIAAVKFSHGLSETEQSLLNEGQVLDRLLAEGKHDGIVPLLDIWAEGDSVPWLRYEYIEGGDLTGLIHRWQGFSPDARNDAVLDHLQQLTKTVGYFHTLKNANGKHDPIVHRDLKPSNILYDSKNKKLKISDFGIGAVSSRRSLTGDASRGMSQGAVLASYLRGSHTPIYASPQQKSGSRIIDPRDDVHALGVIGFQMITGQLDAAPGTDAEFDMQAKGAPDGLIAIIKQCTYRDPARRPQNAYELHEKIQSLSKSNLKVEVLAEKFEKVETSKSGHEAESAHAKQEQVAPQVKPALEVKPSQTKSETETTTQRVIRLEAEARGLQEDARVALRLYDFELAFKILSELRPELHSFRDDAFYRKVTASRERLRRWHKDIHDRLKANQFKDPLLPQLIANYLRLKPNDPEMNDLAQVYPFAPKIGQVFNNAVGMQFAWVPPGESCLGGGGGIPGSKKFTLEGGFWAGIYPVTQGEWKSITGQNPSCFKNFFSDNPRFPVEKVSWNLITQTFLPALNQKCQGEGLVYRLPTEHEWEYICRGGPISSQQSSFHFYFAKSKTDLTPEPTNSITQKTVRFGNVGKTCDVGSFLPNPLGIYDMHGHVWEWTSTEEGNSRVSRGGSWWSHSGLYCSAASRHTHLPTYAESHVGFRLVACPAVD